METHMFRPGQALLMIGLLGLTPAWLLAQEMKIKVVGGGTVETHGEAKAADGSTEQGPGFVDADAKTAQDVLREVRRMRQLMQGAKPADGDLTEEEMNRLHERARERLDSDRRRLADRERENAFERDADDRAEEAQEIKKSRYRASLTALERDLLYRIARLRKPGGDDFESNLDNLEDNVKDTFADLHDQVDDNEPATWGDTLQVARKFYADYGKQIDKWAKDIGVSAEVPNAHERIVDIRKGLIQRLKRLKRLGGEKFEDNFDSLNDKILESYENLEEKLQETLPAKWAEVVKEAEKFESDYTAEMDAWAKKIGADESVPSPLDQLAELKKDLRDRIADLRRIGGDEYEDVVDEIEESVDDTFADLKDKLLNSQREVWVSILEDAQRFHKSYADTMELWQKKIVGADRVDRREVDPAPPQPRVEYPEKDIDLPKGEVADIIEGVRVARLLPLPKKQLGLDHGLSVNEVVDADKPLGRSGLEVYDIILEIEGKKMDTRTDLRDAVSKLERGTEYTIKILRNGKEQTLKARR